MKKAFTLVELIVVIAIVALLAALAFPALRGMFERGNQTESASNLRQIGVALQAYASEHDQYFPLAGGTIPYKSTPVAEGEEISWQQALDEYVGGDRRVFMFPNQPLAGPEIQSKPRINGYFLGSRAAYVDNQDSFAALHMLRIQSLGAYILAGEVAGGAFANDDADRDNYTQEPAFNASTTSGKPVQLLFADGSVRRHTHFDREIMTTRYDGPGLDF